MAAAIWELWSSRSLTEDAKSPAGRNEYVITGAPSEADALALLTATAPLTFGGLWLTRRQLMPKGGGVWQGTADYTVPELVPGTALADQTAGTGGAPEDRPDQPGDEDPLGPEYSFDTTGGTAHITESLATRSRSDIYTLDGSKAPNFKGAIGATDDGHIEGCDKVVSKLEWSTTRPVKSISRKYLKVLGDTTGTVNAAAFFGWAAGEVLLTGVSGQWRNPKEGWSITYKFCVNSNRTNVTVAASLIAPVVKGWDYVWVAYKKATDSASGKLVYIPESCHVERIYEDGDFNKLGL